MRVLALECSTSSVKALVYDKETGVVRIEGCAYPDSVSKDGVSNTEAVFDLLMRVGSEAARNEKIDAVALCGIWHSIALCDESMRPFGQTYGWNYLAPGAMCRAAREDRALSDELYKRTGCMPHVIYMRQTLRYLRENGLDLKGKKLVSQVAYTFYRMTGELLETHNIANGSGFLNVHSLKYDSFAMDYAGIEEKQLGDLANFGYTGRLNQACASKLGIASGIPVVPGYADGALNQLAEGAAIPGYMTLSVGTSGAVRMTVPKPVLPKGRQLWCYCGVKDWMCGGAVSSAGNSINWFTQEFLGGKYTYEELEKGKCPIPRLPVALPFLFGERNPGWGDERTGHFLNVLPQHTVGDLYHALQAGILFNLKQCFEILIAEAGKPKEVYVSGGILSSPKWTQMLADIFDWPMVCAQSKDASSIGAAVLALHAAGGIEDVRGYKPDRTGAIRITPRAENVEAYAKLYARYLEAYDRIGD